MKKLCLILIMLISFTAILPANIHALNVGDKIGDVLNTDVKTYINGERIPCYNINGKAVIIVADLRNYGFDSIYDNDARTSTITRNYNKEFTPVQNISNNTAQAGTVAFPYLYTDIKAVVNDKKVESFNINGNIVIYFESLKDYGTFAWDGAEMSSKLTLYNLSDKMYVITMTGERYHYPNCRTVRQVKQYVTKAEAANMGYTACGICKP